MGAAAIGSIGVLISLVRLWSMINVVETGRTPEYPGIVPRTY